MAKKLKMVTKYICLNMAQKHKFKIFYFLSSNVSYLGDEARVYEFIVRHFLAGVSR